MGDNATESQGGCPGGGRVPTLEDASDAGMAGPSEEPGRRKVGRAQNSSSVPLKSINSWCSQPQVWECDGPSSGDAERFSRRRSPETQPKVYSPKFR